jgi:uncharacterized protein (PEP-CTERM system associated)
LVGLGHRRTALARARLAGCAALWLSLAGTLPQVAFGQARPPLPGTGDQTTQVPPPRREGEPETAPGRPGDAPREGRAGPLFELGLRTRLSYTDNANYAVSGAEKDDWIVEVAPSVIFRSVGSRARVEGELELLGVAYVNNVQPDRLLPRGRVLANFEAIEQLAFIEAAASATQEVLDPFGVRPPTGVNYNTQTTLQYRISPYLQGRLGPDTRFLIRSDNTKTDITGSSTGQALAPFGAGYYGHHVAEIAREPRLLGGALRYERDDNREDVSGAPTFTVETARAILRSAVDPLLTLGLRYGYERNNFTFSEYRNNSIVGAEFDWRPGPRTSARGYVEDRFFGLAWQGTLAHRMPWLALQADSVRELRSYQQWLFSLPTGGNVASLLNEMLVTRVPDAEQRRTLVDDLIRTGRLPNRIDGPVNVLNNGFLRSERTSATIAFVGARATLALNAYHSRDEDLATLGYAPLSIAQIAPGADSVQRGVGLAGGFRLTPTATLLLETQRLETESIPPRLPRSSTQDSHRIQLDRTISRRANAFVGFRFLRTKDEIAGTSSTVFERSPYVGLVNRF